MSFVARGIRERVSKAGEPSWQVQFRLNGKPTGRTFLVYQGAQEFAASVDRIGPDAALRVLEARQGKPSDMPTLREWTARYLDPASGLLTGIEDGSRAGYESAARLSFLPMLGDYPVDAIQKADVGRWLAWQEKQLSKRGTPITPKTIKNRHSLLSAVMASAVSEGLRADNPAYKTRLPKGIPHEGMFLSRDEEATLLAFMPPHYEGLVMFLLGSGCRWGEATALTWADFTPEQPPRAGAPYGKPASVRITKAWKVAPHGDRVLKHPKSSKSRRAIPLHPDTAHALGTPGAPDELVFRGRISGLRIRHASFLQNAWNTAVKKAMDPELCAEHGLTPLSRRPTPHDLRHTHASGLMADGMNIMEVQRRLGHESIQTTTSIYGHLAPGSDLAMVAAVGNRLEGVRPLRQIES